MVNFQLWEANDYNHRLHPEKLVHIIEWSEKVLGLEDLEIEYTDDHIETLNLKEIREKNDKTAMLKAFSLSNGNISETARLLGISRPTFYGLVKQYK